MLPDRVSNPGPLTYESGALPIALRGLAILGLAQISMYYEIIIQIMIPIIQNRTITGILILKLYLTSL